MDVKLTNINESADVAFSYAPAKIIIGGEHAVVYGQPALAMAINRGVRVAVSRLPHKNGPILRAINLGFVGEVRPGPDGEGPQVLRDALEKIVVVFGEEARALHFTIDSYVPVGCGLGSSAALSVALVRGVHRFFGQEISPKAELAMALDLEKLFHGNPSGIDHTVIAGGGLIRFQKHPQENVVQRLTSPRAMRFALGISGPHGGTARAVSLLKERSKRHSDVYGGIFSSIGLIVDEMKKCIDDGRLAALGELMDLNQGFLNALGVSTPKLEALCSIARQRGALGAKLTGAGCGGAVIALVEDSGEEVVQAFSAAGYMAFSIECELNAQGA